MNRKTLWIVTIAILAVVILGLSRYQVDTARDEAEQSLRPLQLQVSRGVENATLSLSVLSDRSTLADHASAWRLMEDTQRQATQQQELLRQQQQSQRIMDEMQRSQRQAQEQSQRIVDDMQRAQRQAQEQSQRMADDMRRQAQQQSQRSLEDAARRPGALSLYQPPLYSPPLSSIPSLRGGAPGRP